MCEWCGQEHPISAICQVRTWTRRSFLSMFGVGVAGLVLGPMAMATPAGQISLNEINEIAKQRIMPGVVDSFFQDGPLLAHLKKNSLYTP